MATPRIHPDRTLTSAEEYSRFAKKHPNYMRDYSRRCRILEPKRAILYRARSRAKQIGISCTLTVSDIPDIPEFCPVFPWIKLEYRVGDGIVYRESAPSLDRINNDRGYEPGNVRIISDRANRLKSNATFAEIQALVKDFEVCEALNVQR